jgi:hypothetical protein
MGASSGGAELSPLWSRLPESVEPLLILIP